MGRHPEVIDAMRDAAARHGVGSAARAYFGHKSSPRRARSRIGGSAWQGGGACLYVRLDFQSGGDSTIGDLLPNCLILSDEFNHNSMIEGIRRSKAQRQFSAITISRISKSFTHGGAREG